MSKLTTQSTFDVAQISGTNSFNELQSFFEYVNLLASDVVTAMANNVDITNNLKFWSKTITFKHGVPIELPVNPKFILLKSTKPILYNTCVTNSKGNPEVSIFFKDTLPVRAISAVWQSGTIVKYVTDNTTKVFLGDFVNVSGFGLAANNGTFHCIEVDGVDIYCLNRNRTSATGDELRQTYAGSSDTGGIVTIGVFL